VHNTPGPKLARVYLSFCTFALSIRLYSIFLWFLQMRHSRAPRIVNSRLSPDKLCPSLHCVRFKLWSRPLAILSLILSWVVPKNKCVGFTHAGTSQRWQMSSPGGMGPCASSHDMRWAPVILSPFLFTPNPPYPFLYLAPVHNQQRCSSVFATFVQNLFETSLLTPMTQRCHSCCLTFKYKAGGLYGCRA
jgi:hypothetical protein